MEAILFTGIQATGKSSFYRERFFQVRMPVSLVVNLVANGMTVDEILREYPLLEAEDLRQALSPSTPA